MTDITIPDAAVEAAARADYDNWNGPAWDDAYEHEREHWRSQMRTILTAAAPHIAAQEREAVAEEIDLAAVMEHLLNDGTRDGLILADKINVAVGASRVRRMRLLASIEEDVA